MTKFSEYKAAKKAKEEGSGPLPVSVSNLDYSKLLERILAKEISLDEVINAIREIPTQTAVDMSPVVKAINGIKIEKNIIEIPEQKPDIETHKLLKEMLEELKKKRKNEQLNKQRQEVLEQLIQRLRNDVEDIEKKFGNFSLDFSVQSKSIDLSSYVQESFETFSKNLKAYPYTITETSSTVTTIVYNTGAGTITKTITEVSPTVTTIVFSGDYPLLITTKTITDGAPIAISYS